MLAPIAARSHPVAVPPRGTLAVEASPTLAPDSLRLGQSTPRPGVARAADGLIGLVAFEHVGFLVMEMFLWAKPIGQKIFGTTAAFAAESASLAANQGLYNGFLAAGLFWSLLLPAHDHATRQTKMFFLGCVAVAGAFGGLTTKASIFFVQAVPALLAMGLVWLADRRADDRPA